MANRRLTRRQVVVGGTAALASLALGPRLRAGPRKFDYDLCIIGSGFAGMPLAMRAVEKGLGTVVLEAGSGLASTFSYSNSGPLSYPVDVARLIAAGGTSGKWFGITTRLFPQDFRVRSLYGTSTDWPIGYDDLEPYYCESEKLLSIDKSTFVRDVQPIHRCTTDEEIDGFKRSPPLEVDGRGLEFFTPAKSRRGGRVVRLSEVEIPNFAQSPLGTYLEGRRVTEIVSLDGESVDHVVTRDVKGETTRISARRFVLAAGVMESARLLLSSRSSHHPEGLGNGSGLLGRYFSHHPTFRMSFLLESRFPWPMRRTHSLDSLLRKEGLSGCNLQVQAGAGNSLVLRLSPEVEPTPDNRLTLSSRVDPMGLSEPDLQLSFSERDERSFKRVQDIGRRISTELSGPATFDYVRGVHYHPSGPCRMAADAKHGVVDRNNKVFGLENLYVSGASVFPTNGTTNPTNTVVALSYRLADHLLERGRA